MQYACLAWPESSPCLTVPHCSYRKSIWLPMPPFQKMSQGPAAVGAGAAGGRRLTSSSSPGSSRGRSNHNSRSSKSSRWQGNVSNGRQPLQAGRSRAAQRLALQQPAAAAAVCGCVSLCPPTSALQQQPE
jgi:hypothetical protein